MLLTGSVWAQDYDDGGDKVQASDIAHALSGRPWYVSGMFSSVDSDRSDEHTSELQSLMRISYAAFCLKKKIKHNNNSSITAITSSKHNSTRRTHNYI